jgi:hypothetical protein
MHGGHPFTQARVAIVEAIAILVSRSLTTSHRWVAESRSISIRTTGADGLNAVLTGELSVEPTSASRELCAH